MRGEACDWSPALPGHRTSRQTFQQFFYFFKFNLLLTLDTINGTRGVFKVEAKFTAPPRIFKEGVEMVNKKKI